MLAADEDEAAKEVEVDEEADGEVEAFFLAGGQTVELKVRRFLSGACLSIPS